MANCDICKMKGIICKDEFMLFGLSSTGNRTAIIDGTKEVVISGSVAGCNVRLGVVTLEEIRKQIDRQLLNRALQTPPNY